MSIIAASNSCVWLMAVGGEPAKYDLASSCIFLELSEWLNEKAKKQAETCDKH